MVRLGLTCVVGVGGGVKYVEEEGEWNSFMFTRPRPSVIALKTLGGPEDSGPLGWVGGEGEGG